MRDVDGSAFERAWRERFERFGLRHTDDAGVAGWSDAGLNSRVRSFLRVWSARDRAGEVWFDAGCGAGTYLKILERAGAHAIGADYSLPSVQQARARGCSDTFVGDITRLPVRSEIADGVLCFGVTQATSSTSRIVDELLRIAKPGGEVWIDGLNYWAVTSIVDQLRRFVLRKKRHLRYERPANVRRALRAAGATSIEFHWLPLAPSNARWLQRVFDSAGTVAVFRGIRPLAALLSHSFLVKARRSA